MKFGTERGELIRVVAAYGLLVAATVVAGLAVRFGRLGLPALVVKYGGSAMWALAIYWGVAMAAGLWRPQWAGVAPRAVVAGSVATAVEFFKLYRSPGVDAFRTTLPGMLLLGKYFSVWDLVAYWVAIGCGVIVDGWAIRPWIAAGRER